MPLVFSILLNYDFQISFKLEVILYLGQNTVIELLKICDFPYPTCGLTKNLIPYLSRPMLKALFRAFRWP